MSGLLILFAILGGGILFVVTLYNALVRKKIEAENSWSQIDVQLKRRYDLIPNLVDTVKGYAAHERQTLDDVISARNMAMGATGKGAAAQAQAENMLSGTLKSLFALQEAYPDLKANQNFQALQEEIASTENRIGFARQHYNDSVATYKTAIQSFPSNIVAGFFSANFPAKDYFELGEEEAKAAQQPPKVSF
jgi:LemA protein